MPRDKTKIKKHWYSLQGAEPERYRDLSGGKKERGSSMRKLVVNAFLVILVDYIAWAQPYGIVLPGGWPPYVVLGGFYLGALGYGAYGWLRMFYDSSKAMWPTGQAPVHKLQPIGTPFYPDREYAELFHCYINFGPKQVDGVTMEERYYWPYRIWEVNGSNRYLNLEGHDFVVAPWIELRQAAPDWSTGEQVIHAVNYSHWPWGGADGFFINGDTTYAQRHNEIPPFMLDQLRELRGFRDDPSVGGEYRKSSASRVDFALHPKFDPWSMRSIEWPEDLKQLAKMHAKRENVAVETADAALARQGRFARALGETGPNRTPQPEPGQAPSRPWNEEGH